MLPLFCVSGSATEKLFGVRWGYNEGESVLPVMGLSGSHGGFCIVVFLKTGHPFSVVENLLSSMRGMAMNGFSWAVTRGCPWLYWWCPAWGRPFRKFHGICGAPPETLPNFNYDASREVCGDKKLFDSPLQKFGPEPIW